MKEEIEQLKEKIITIVNDLNIADEEWIRKYGEKSYYDLFLELFAEQKAKDRQRFIKILEEMINIKPEGDDALIAFSQNAEGRPYFTGYRFGWNKAIWLLNQKIQKAISQLKL